MSYKETERYKNWLEKRFPKKVEKETEEIKEIRIDLINERLEKILRYGFAIVKDLNRLEIYYLKIRVTDNHIVVKENNGRLYRPIYA